MINGVRLYGISTHITSLSCMSEDGVHDFRLCTEVAALQGTVHTVGGRPGRNPLTFTGVRFTMVVSGLPLIDRVDELHPRLPHRTVRVALNALSSAAHVPLTPGKGVAGPHSRCVLRATQVQYYSMINVFHAYSRDLHLRSLYFDRTAEGSWPGGFFGAPGALEYVLSQRAPFVVSLRICAEWSLTPKGSGGVGGVVGRIDSRPASVFEGWANHEVNVRRHRFFHVRLPTPNEHSHLNSPTPVRPGPASGVPNPVDVHVACADGHRSM